MNNLFQDETTQAYLNAIREVCFTNAFHNMTSACVAYLSLDAFTGEISEDALKNIDSRLHFTRHAAKNLGDYARRIEEDEKMSAAILEFFQRPDRVATFTVEDGTEIPPTQPNGVSNVLRKYKAYI
jgi:hypothetical protein